MRRAKTIARRVKLAKSADSPFAGLFHLNEQLTSQAILERLRSAIVADVALSILQDPQKLTEKKAVSIAKDYVTLKRGKNAARENCYNVLHEYASMSNVPEITDTCVIYQNVSLIPLQ